VLKEGGSLSFWEARKQDFLRMRKKRSNKRSSSMPSFSLWSGALGATATAAGD
jgi:hypothetical protein